MEIVKYVDINSGIGGSGGSSSSGCNCVNDLIESIPELPVASSISSGDVLVLYRNGELFQFDASAIAPPQVVILNSDNVGGSVTDCNGSFFVDANNYCHFTLQMIGGNPVDHLGGKICDLPVPANYGVGGVDDQVEFFGRTGSSYASDGALVTAYLGGSNYLPGTLFVVSNPPNTDVFNGVPVIFSGFYKVHEGIS